MAQAREYAKENVQITLVGNKIDLNASQRKVKHEEAKRMSHSFISTTNNNMLNVLELAAAYNIYYIETSAKTGQNVREAFQLLARLVCTSMIVNDNWRI